MNDLYEKHLALIYRRWGKPKNLVRGRLREAHDEADRKVRKGDVPVADFRGSPGARSFIERVKKESERQTTDVPLGSLFGSGALRLVASVFGGVPMKVYETVKNLFPAALRDYVPTVVATVVILLNTGLSALGFGIDVMTFIEVVAPAGVFGQIATARNTLWVKGGSAPGQVTSKTVVLAGGGLLTIATMVAVSIFFPEFLPLVTQIGTILLGALGLGAGAAMQAGTKKVKPVT